jgi:uncharacterized alpha-E superfamily protein
VISRVAESCFWLNRYIERAEVLARMLGVNLAFQLDVALPDAERWRPLVVVSGQERDFLERTDASKLDDSETVQEYLTWDAGNPSSLYSSLYWARENARRVRETISLEMWEVLNDLWVWLGSPAARRSYRSDRFGFYLHIRNQCLLFHGVAQATMLHEDPFEFMRLGTSLERAGQTARLLDIKHHSVGPTDARTESPVEAAQWLETLRFCSGVEPFLKREDRPFSGRAVADFLLFDAAFPRSVLHNLQRTRNFLALVRPPLPTEIGERSHQLVEEMLEEFDGRTIDDVLDHGLHETVTWVVAQTAAICEAIRADFFDPAPIGPRSVRSSQRQSQGEIASQAQRSNNAG